MKVRRLKLNRVKENDKALKPQVPLTDIRSEKNREFNVKS